jgi:alpha-amylase
MSLRTRTTSPAWRAAVAALLALAAAACHEVSTTPSAVGGPPPPRPTLNPTYRPSGHMLAGDVFVHLFEWRWADIATECEQVLGPAGFAAVQVSPPQEHSITPSHDWSERYQPVSYSIARSRSGDSTAFVDMVRRCKAVGVGIYVDAVINHMTNYPNPDTGSNRTITTKYNYPGLYTLTDFHPYCVVSNYADAANVQDCELFSLPDLNTELPHVRTTLAGYLIKLGRLGVAGFRIDAAKHIQQVSLDSIFRIVDSTMTAEGRPIPYYFLEVSSGYGEALSYRDYLGEAYSSGGAADITEFTFTGVGDKFLGTGGQNLADLNPNGPPGHQFSALAWGLEPSDKAVAFLQNHDTQHQQGKISYRDGQTFRLANVWMLAQPYGYLSILSSYAFDFGNTSMGPPSDASGWTLPVTCATSLETAAIGQWVCEHRDPYLRNMVAFRKAVAGTDVNHWWDNGANAIAFSRGAKGFVAISREAAPVSAAVATGLPPGTYCDVITGGLSGTACAGTSVVVDSTGTIQLRLGSNAAIAIDAANRM